MKAKAILLQPDMATYLNMLSDEEAGALFKAIFRYATESEELETDNRAVKMAFLIAREQIARSSEKYEEACIKKKEAIKRRWQKNKSTQTNTDECKSTDNNSNLYKSIQENTDEYKCIDMNSNLYISIDNNTNSNSNSNSNPNSNSSSNSNPNSNSNRNSSICNTNTIVNSIPNVGGEVLKEKNKKEKTAAETAADAAERVVKRIEKEKNDFWEECETFIKAYGEEMVRDFYGYWTEDFQHGTGFRKQKEKTWNTARRLSTWARKQMEINNRYGSRNIGRGYDLSTPEGRAKDAAERIARNIQEECSDDDWMP